MFEKIMTPVDLTQKNELEKALQCSADLAKQYDAIVTFVGVTGSAPGELAHNAEEYSARLDAFAAEQAEKFGISVNTRVQHCNDLTTDVDDALLAAAKETGADLVVMQSHLPSLSDYLWPSNGGKIAAHSKTSVMLVRD